MRPINIQEQPRPIAKAPLSTQKNYFTAEGIICRFVEAPEDRLSIIIKYMEGPNAGHCMYYAGLLYE
jgi:hypothetical protein